MQGRRRHTGRSCWRKSRWAPAPALALAWLPLLRYFDIIWLQHLHSFTGRPQQFHSRGSERKTSPSTLQKTFSIVTNSRVAGWHSGSGAALYKGRCHGIRTGMHKMHGVPAKAASNPHPQDITALRARICDNSVASASKRLKGSTIVHCRTEIMSYVAQQRDAQPACHLSYLSPGEPATSAQHATGSTAARRKGRMQQEENVWLGTPWPFGDGLRLATLA